MNTHTLGDPTLIVGCGDIGRRVARLLIAQGRTVRAIVRRPEGLSGLTALGVAAECCDLDVAAPAAAPTVFWFAPPPPDGRVDTRLRRFLSGRPAVTRIVYISTSGVYGDCQGQWIDESAPLQPRTDRGRRRLDAEQALFAAAALQGLEAVVLRVPGIYGPGRLPEQRLRLGQPVVLAQESPYSNRIHAEDLARVAVAAAARGQPGAAYNVSDGHPTTMTDYFLRCARWLDLPEPPQVSLAVALREFTPAMRSFLTESRRLQNYRMIRQLGIVLQFPTLELGLPSCGRGSPPSGRARDPERRDP